MATAALDGIGTRVDGMEREIVAVVHEGEERIAILVTVDAERVAMTVLAGDRIGAGGGAVHAQPRHLVVLGQQRHEVGMAGRARRRWGT